MDQEPLDISDVDVDMFVSEDSKEISFTVKSNLEISPDDFIRIVQMVLSTDDGGLH